MILKCFLNQTGFGSETCKTKANYQVLFRIHTTLSYIVHGGHGTLEFHHSVFFIVPSLESYLGLT